jgi:hypothetical protein
MSEPRWNESELWNEYNIIKDRADRLAARVAELERENRAMLFRQKESGGSCFPPNSLEKQLELTEIHNESIKKQSEELFDRIEDLAAELAAAKADNGRMKTENDRLNEWIGRIRP